MNTVNPKSGSLGFTLIEMLVGVVILGIVMSIAVPSFQAYILNSQIGTAAESIQNGLQRARGEAVARNTNVEFAFVGADTSWRVTVVGGANIETRSGNEGSKTVTRVTLPPGATTITFNNLGQIAVIGGAQVNADGSLPLAQVNLDSSQMDPAQSRDLIIAIGVGGSARVCDPNVAYPNPRSC